MENWIGPLLFGVALVTFVLAVSFIVTSFMLQKTDAKTAMKQKIIYRLCGIGSLIIWLFITDILL